MTGIGMALEEITLVLFTTLAPSGAAALVLVGLPILAGKVEGAVREALDKLVVFPLVVAMVGLVASATHLGNPANALYVLAGIGRSPLSNEVACGVAFLALAGFYWLTAFSEHPRQKLRRVLLAAMMAAGVLFVVAIAFAYDADTIVTWHTPYVPLSLGLCALAGGPLLAALTMRLAKCPLVRGAYGLALVVLSGVAAACAAVTFVLQGMLLSDVANHMAKAADLVPGYFFAVVVFVLLAFGGAFTAAIALHKGKSDRWASLPALVGAVLLALVAIFVMRFCFYMSHMTVGLGV